jgi:hypothetical protein
MLKIPSTLNGYTVIHSYTGPTIGVILVEIYPDHWTQAPTKYVVATITEESLSCGGWINGTYTHNWNRAIKLFQTKVIDFIGSSL